MGSIWETIQNSFVKPDKGDSGFPIARCLGNVEVERTCPPTASALKRSLSGSGYDGERVRFLLAYFLASAPIKQLVAVGALLHPSNQHRRR